MASWEKPLDHRYRGAAWLLYGSVSAGVLQAKAVRDVERVLLDGADTDSLDLRTYRRFVSAPWWVSTEHGCREVSGGSGSGSGWPSRGPSSAIRAY